MILVVGATGQLGTAVVRKLMAAKQPVRAFVRDGSNFLHLDLLNAALWFGDLCDAENVEVACEGVETVIATANALLPRNGDCFEKVQGAANLMGWNWAVSISPTSYDSKETESFFDLPRTTVEQFLRREASLAVRRCSANWTETAGGRNDNSKSFHDRNSAEWE